MIGVAVRCRYDIHPPSKSDLEREVLARADADFERLFGAD